MTKLILILAILAGAALVGAMPAGNLTQAEHQFRPSFELVQVSRGKVTTRVVAAGTVQPVLSVVVGSQVSGQVKEILVDFNDFVRNGQPLARLDAELFETRAEQARAEVDVARDAVQIAQGEVAIAEAAIKRMLAERSKAEAEKDRGEAVVANAQQRLQRKLHLMKSGANSASDTEDARAAHAVALAELSSGNAQVLAREVHIEEARAQVAVARSRVAHAEALFRRNEAALRQAEADLERTVIRSPMEGIVIERSVTAGQTVAASFQAPNLFTIGDLRSVSVEIAVDEADIGLVRVGQAVTFAVDAYNDMTFTGTISQVRKAPYRQENVVTYTAVATAANADLLLLPGMTAKVEITAQERPDALQVPTAALRYRPRGLAYPSGANVWVFDGNEIYPVAVQAGVTDAGMTELVRGDIAEGQQVVVGEGTERLASETTVWQSFRIKAAGWLEPLQTAFTAVTFP
jgi:HlyD family secretion protein